jgi:predicted amidophosphoribosyltransferase
VPPREVPKPAGFGKCPTCAYRMTGTPELCFGCARRHIERVHARRCDTCDQTLREDRPCSNPLCNRDVTERGWEFIWAIAMRSGRLKSVISAYKYDNVKGWAWILGRILVGYLQANAEVLRTYDLIVPMPTYVGEGGRGWDHVGLIIERAEIEGPEWPFHRDLLAKTHPTPTMVGLKTFRKRAEMAERELRPSLQVTSPSTVAGRDVLVFDDVFTGGLSMREAAYKLKHAGASSVAGLVLARQPY